MNTITIKGVEYEAQTHDFGTNLSEIAIPKGWRLWTAIECVNLHNNIKHRKALTLEDCWFFIQQPFKSNKKFVAWFGAYSDRAYLGCLRGPSDTNSSLGVRFCREVKK